MYLRGAELHYSPRVHHAAVSQVHPSTFSHYNMNFHIKKAVLFLGLHRGTEQVFNPGLCWTSE